MKTKKEIYNWWLDRGKIVDINKEDDFESLVGKIDKAIFWTKERIDGKHFKVKMISPRWKYPIYLVFYCSGRNENKSECYQIVNF